MREARLFHEIRDADPFEAPLPEELGCGLDYPFTVLGGLFPAHFHPDLPRFSSLDIIHDARHIICQ
jgi:hypothetical protein